MYQTTKINPAAVHTPQGFRRLKRGEPLQKGDMFLCVVDLHWMPWNRVSSVMETNQFTNCIRPVKQIAQHCSYNDFQ